MTDHPSGSPELWEVSDNSSDAELEHKEQIVAQNPPDELAGVGSAGEIFCYGSIPNALDPELFIKDHGPIRFPIVQDDVDKVIAASNQESIGTNIEKYPSKQHSWILPADKIETQNPAWAKALEYNLHHTSPQDISSASAVVAPMLDLQSLLRSWNKNRDLVDDFLGYALQEDYGLKVAYKDLQGTDRFAVRKLHNVCQRVGFYVCLALFEHKVEGTCGHYGYNGYDDESSDDENRTIEDVMEISFNLNRVNELSGTLICNKPSFTEDSLIQDIFEDIFEYGVPEYQYYDRRHDILSQSYHRSIVLIMPCNYKWKFILSNQNQSIINRTIDTFFDLLQNPSDLHPSTLEDLIYLCGLMVETKPGSWGSVRSGFSKETLIKKLTLIANTNHQTLFECALPAYFANEKSLSLIATMTRKHEPDWLSTTLLPVIHINQTAMVFELLALIARKLLPCIASQQFGYLTIIYQHILSNRIFAGKLGLDFYNTRPPPNDTYPDYSWLAEILYAANRLGMSLEMKRILDNVICVAQKANEKEFITHLLPFCCSLIAMSRKHPPEFLHTPALQLFFQSALSWYIFRCKPVEPRWPVDWVRSARGCGCSHCKHLDQFLTHPERIGETFKTDFQTREESAQAIEHLKGRLLADLEEKSISVSAKGNEYRQERS
ncbi:hypothetical protein NHQ30_009202 [Ciborinia camelliae]|nr:hypothetical protein NHQ30_009202 [Ciborinia camelliae]